MTTVDDIKAALVSILEPSLRVAGVSVTAVDDEFDLRKAGLIDSLGLIRLLAELERRLGRSIDLSSMDTERLTNIGALARHIAAQPLAK